MTSAGPSTPQDAVFAALAHIWPEARADALERLDRIEAALTATPVAPTAQAAAGRAAHQLAGTLGTFGLTDGSEIARRIEQELRRPIAPRVAHEQRARCVALRAVVWAS